MEQAHEKAPRALTIQEVAEELNVCTETIRRMLQAGALKGFRVNKCWRIPAEEIDRLIATTQ